jgi:ryanodine receptor 2
LYEYHGENVYVPQPIDTAHVILPEGLLDLVERLAENAHDVWAQRRLAEGWTWGPRRDDSTRQHPCLVAYAELPDSEKQYDRNAVLQVLKGAVALGYGIDETGARNDKSRGSSPPSRGPTDESG